jgi:hypothetical protein
MKTIKEFINESLINEKLNYKNQITKKICKAFGLTEQDNFTDAIDNWVTDNNVKNVEFYTHDIKELHDMGMPKSIINMYSDDKQMITKIEQSIKSAKTLSEEDHFEIFGNSEVLAFVSDSEDNLYVYNVK